MTKLYFATSNERKLAEAKQGCEPFGIEIIQQELDFDEIQSHEPLAIAKHKAVEAFSKIKKPLVINDSSWMIPALNGFPGGYAKDVAKWFIADDWMRLMNGVKDRRVCLREDVIYVDGKVMKDISMNFWGTVVEKPRGIGNSLENVMEFNGVTLGENRKNKTFAFEAEDYIWYKFAKWYSKNAPKK